VENPAVQSADAAFASAIAALAASITALVPSGAIMDFAYNSAPAGWLVADGSIISRLTYAPLFAVIGTLYGVGNGTTTFNLPDFRGYYRRGAVANGDGATGGFPGEKQVHQLQSHTHTVGRGSQNGTSSGNGTSPNAFQGASDSSFPATTSSSTGGGETRPYTISVLTCIKI
jgi:microcystin-dependent protein